MGVKKQITLAVDPNPAWRSPVQHELDGLFGELAAFNERIAELVKHGHRSHALTVLKGQALSLAGQIDELRAWLAAPKRNRTNRTQSLLTEFQRDAGRRFLLAHSERRNQ
jgi:hypothetical protein